MVLQRAWLLWLALNAPHSPFHVPPEELHDYTLSGDPDDDPFPHYLAMIQAMDTELGRLLAGIDAQTLANTYIIYLGDNGALATTNQGIYPDDHAKASLFQGGVHVPMVITGPGVVAGRAAGLVQITDLHATILELIGAAPVEGVEYDGVSIVPMLSDASATVRSTMHLEFFGPGLSERRAGRAVRDDRYKLMYHYDGTERFFDLSADPLELVPLEVPPQDPELSAAYAALVEVIATIPTK